MTHEEKIKYLEIAAGIAHFGFKYEQLDLLVSLYELVLKKKGKSNIEDVVNVEFEVDKRTEIRGKQELLDKHSKKVDS